MEKDLRNIALPMVALRGLCVFPGMILHFDVARDQSIEAVRTAMDSGRDLFLASQKDPSIDNPTYKDIYRTGVVASVLQIITIPNSKNLRVIVEGKSRATFSKGYNGAKFLCVDINRKPEKGFAKKDEIYAEALLRKARDIFEEYSQFTPKISPDIVLRLNDDEAPGVVADYISSVIHLPFDKKQLVLQEMHPLRRLEKVCELLTSEIEYMKLETEITEKVEQAVDDNQREYYLREQLRVLSAELDGEDSVSEIADYKKKIADIKCISDKSREKLTKECDRLQKMGSSSSSEAAVIRNYLDTVLALPFDSETKDNLDLSKARRVLDADHYGLSDVKDRIVELLAVRSLNENVNGQIICLAGPPGVGKTSIARALADAMGRKYARVSLGGVRDESEIRGHRKTYIGSMPGRVINALSEAGTKNPLILFDEIDKMSSDMRGDPASAMLEVLDAEQNKSFVDHYVEIPFDLSKVLFVTTANDKNNIPAPLLDRMEVIDLYSYTAEEKFQIAKKHLVSKAIERNGLTKNQIKITDAAIKEIISSYTREAGVRNLERKINEICRKTALRVVNEKADENTLVMKVTPKELPELLGTPKYKEKNELKNEVGVTNGLAWTSVGGEMLKVEVAVMEGKGNVELTGSLGDVMKESAKAAVSFIRSNSTDLGITEPFYKEKDIHIHVPEGAVPKDGPSAGVTMATSLVSALTKRPVNGKVAMTGEISLTGKVMPIGGLREKSMAAYKAGVKKVLIPHGNLADLDDVDKVVKSNVEFVPVSTLKEVFDNALC